MFENDERKKISSHMVGADMSERVTLRFWLMSTHTPTFDFGREMSPRIF